MQKIYNEFNSIKEIIEIENIKKPLVVCDKFIRDSFVIELLKKEGLDCVLFSEFKPNPLYEDVLKGIDTLNTNNCDFIISIGGGSAIDVAKCISLFLALNPEENYLKQEFKDAKYKHLAIPTTAGTGSESTRYAVIYYEGVKQSVTHNSIVPNYVVLEGKLLETLPTYQKKSTIMDALCQAIESYWSVNSTEESKQISKEAITIILDNINDYIFNSNPDVNNKIMYAANLSGQAINITQTTAAHAMSYKLTSLYGISHGHAVAVCLPYVLEFMINNYNKTIDSRGKDYLEKTLNELSILFGVDEPIKLIDKFKKIFTSFELQIPKISEEELEILTISVNPTRLKNNPVELEKEDINIIYQNIKNNYKEEKIYEYKK